MNLYGFVGNDGVDLADILGLKATMICNRCKETKGPMRCIIYDTIHGMVGDPFTTNEGTNTRPTPTGKFDLLPKPDSQMDPENRGMGPHNVNDGPVAGPGGKPEFPVGTPSITGPGLEPGRPYSNGGWRATVRVHYPGRSEACITTDRCGDVQRMMEENRDDGGMKIEITEFCCKKGELPPDPAPRATPVK